MSDEAIEAAIVLEEDAPVDAPLVPTGEPCASCGAPGDPDDHFCNACGKPREAEADQTVDAEAPEQKYIRCENCGSELACDINQRSYVCPFCDSTYVVEFSRDQSDRQPPEFVIGFGVTLEAAQQKFSEWLKQNSWFRPGDLHLAQVTDKMKGVYLPFWSFSMLANSDWRASIGENWQRTESYMTMEKGKMVRRTRTVTETEWWPLEGKHHRYYSGYLVSGSRGLPQAQADRIKPFRLESLHRYQPYFLAGWMTEEYSIVRQDALAQCQQEFYRRETSNVTHFLPGDKSRELKVGTSFSAINSDLILLPVYILSYQYEDKLFRFLVNGQTGKIAGDKPVSKKRITAAVVGGLLLILFILLFLFFMAR